jgi:hypothetical protein
MTIRCSKLERLWKTPYPSEAGEALGCDSTFENLNVNVNSYRNLSSS